MQFMQFTAARADTGAVLPLAKATVYLTGTGTKATLYDNVGGALANPVTATSVGLVSFAAADDLYDIVITSADTLYTTPTMVGVQLYDLSVMAAAVGTISSKAPLASPALTGTPTVPTATAGTNTTQAASTGFVTSAVGVLTTGADSSHDTFLKLQNIIVGVQSTAATLATTVGGKLTAASNLSDLIDAPTARQNLGVRIGVNVQAYSGILDALVAGSVWSAGVQVPVFTAAGTVVLKTVGSASGNLLSRADGDALYTPIGGAGGVPTGDKGDITVTGTGGITWTIDNNVVTYAKFQAAATAGLMGATAAGNFGLIPLGTGMAFSGGNLVCTVTGGVTDGDKGDVVISGSGTVYTIDTNAVSFSKFVAAPSAGLVGANASGNYQHVTPGAYMTLSSGVLAVNGTPFQNLAQAAMESGYRSDAHRAAHFTPKELFSPGLGGGWWDIQDLSTIFSDTAGTTLAAVNGPVGYVRDKSGNNNHLICPGSSGNRPTLKQTGSIYYLWFDGVDDALQALFSVSIAFDRISRIQVEAAATDHYIFGGGTDYAGTLYQHGGTGLLTLFSGSNGPTVPFTVGTDLTVTEHFYGTLSNGAANNGLFGSTGTVGTAVAGGITIGDSHTGVSSPFSQMRLYGLVMIDRQLTPREIGLCRYAVTPKSVTVPPSICFVGDSIVADNGTNQPAISTFFADATINSIAHPGDTIANQKTLWQALSSGTRAAFRAVVVQVGVNDNNPATATATTIAAYQDLITTIRGDLGSQGRIYISQMTPAAGRWVGIGWDPTTAQAKWQAVNDAIAGFGNSAITGVDGRITSHIALLGDASHNLLAAYDETSDHIHPNYWGRRIISLAWREVLAGDGLVRP